MESKSRPVVPDDIASPRAKLVYLYVATTDGATIERVRDDLGITTGSLLSIVATLRERGYVERTETGLVAI